MQFTPLLLCMILSGLFVSTAVADDPVPDAIRNAVTKSLTLLEAGAKGSREERPNCYTCHNAGVPVIALTAARSRGFAIDRKELDAQLQFTADFLKKNEKNYLAGKGQGGVDTAGSALWALDRGGWTPDATTAAVAEFLLVNQKNVDYWKSNSKRPPTQQSIFTTTFAALRGLKAFGTTEQKERIEKRTEQVRTWLAKAKPDDTEDRVSRLRLLHEVGAKKDTISEATQELLKSQRGDGGWSQKADMSSDAYATGTALVALIEAGGVTTDDAAYRKGLRYLLAIQKDDGSWHVTTRSKPIQSYYESGYPHEKDQFISITAAGWATTALVLALPTK
ncbi:hypothetical protein BH11PLA2_BH11PLA2_27700 [soil metagenome]